MIRPKRQVVAGLMLLALVFAPAFVLAAAERQAAPQTVLRIQNFSAGTHVRLRPAFDRPRPKSADFVVTYIGFPSAARVAFQRAVDIWSTLISSPVAIRIEARWQPLDPDVLGSAGAAFINRDFPGATVPGTFFVDALADALGGVDLGGGAADIIANFNSTFPNWYFGTDGNPAATEFDLVTVVLHEIAHGLGMTGSVNVDASGLGFWGLGLVGTTLPLIYDVFTEALDGTAVLDTTSLPNPSTLLGDALTDRLFFGGPQALGALGQRVELYAPPTFLLGSSYSHFDEALFPPGDANALMTPFLALDEVIHDPGDQLLCLLEDLGWQTIADCGPQPATCVASDVAFCLQGGRFRVEVGWRTFDGTPGVARAVTGSQDSALFYFFNPNNWEMLVKVLDNCNGNTNRFWVFAAATTNVEYTLQVTDTQSGQVRTYFNPLGVSASAITDTSAFATCP